MRYEIGIEGAYDILRYYKMGDPVTTVVSIDLENKVCQIVLKKTEWDI